VASTGFAGGRAGASADAARDRRALVAGVLLLTLATLFVYWGVWRFELVNFDDAIALGGAERIVGDWREDPPGNSERSAAILDPGGKVSRAGERSSASTDFFTLIARAFEYRNGHEYLPVRDLSYVLDHEMSGGWDAGSLHAMNLVLHMASGVLVIALATQMGTSVAASLLAGALFLLHPIQVESVAWVASRKDLLAGMFVLLSWHAHARRWRAWSAIAFLAAALSKATVVVFPSVLVVSSVVLERARWRDAVRRAAPHFIIAAVAAALQLRSAGEAGMLARASHARPLETILMAAKIPFLYFAHIAWPTRLHVLYAPSTPAPGAMPSWLAPAGLVLLGVVAVRLARGARPRPLIGVGLAAFLFLLAPTLGLVPFQLLMADRYAYVAMGGLAVACAGLVGAVRRPAFYVPFLVAIPLALVARREALAWRNSETLWQREIARDPVRTEAWANLGEHYLLRGRAAEAADALSHAAQLRPESHQILTNYALAAARAGRSEQAAAAIDSALARAPNDPLVHYNAACVRAAAGESDLAIAELSASIRLGFADRDAIILDPDLARLRGDRRFWETLGLRDPASMLQYIR